MSSDLRDQLQAAIGDAYRVTRELGGGMARVFEAEDQSNGERVVIKVLAAELSVGVSLERFRREIQVAESLVHPNIVPVRGAGQKDKLVWYTMPYIDGESLRGLLLRERQLPVARVVEIVRDVGAALAYAHAAGIVHRDIKPDNILIDASGRAFVTDFGIARAIEKSADVVSITSTGLTLGTPAYMSPEQAAGDSNIDTRSDIYSLACVVYEMLGGEPPFTGPTAQAIIARHLHEAPRSLRVVRPAIGPALEAVVEKALAKNAADRFTTVAAFVDAMGSPPPVADRRLRTNLIRAGVALAVIGTAALGLWYSRRGPVPDPTRVAVLYFDAPKADSDLVTIARGVTRDVIASLPTDGLVVVSASGIERFAPTDEPGVVSAALGGAGTLVYGNVEPLGGRDSIRVNVSIVDAQAVRLGDFKVESPRTAALRARDAVVRQVAEQLRVRLGRSVAFKQWRASTQSSAAWTLRNRAAEVVARARDMATSGAQPQALLAYLQADSLLMEAARADPAWPEPRIARGWVMLSRATLTATPGATAAVIDSAIQLAEAVVHESAESGAALELRGTLRYRKWQFILRGSDPSVRDSAESDIRRATITEGASARAWSTYSAMLQERGDRNAAVDAARRAIGADPYLRDVAPSYSRLIFAHLDADRQDSAAALCDGALRVFPTDRAIQQCKLAVLGVSGRGQADIRAAWSAVEAEERTPMTPTVEGMLPSSRYQYAAVLARSGLRDSANRMVTAVRAAVTKSTLSGGWLLDEAHVRAELGQVDSAIVLLRSFLREMPAGWPRMARHPWFRAIRDDPRFRQLEPRSVSSP